MSETNVILKYNDIYEDYLSDESCKRGNAQSISFPRTKEDIVAVVKHCAQTGTPITVQGSRTGITGAAVPTCGHVISCRDFKCEPIFIDNPPSITVSPGVTLEELEHIIRRESANRYFLPPLPTEKTATIGGAIASGGAGPLCFRYGTLRDYVDGAEICDSKGDLASYSKEECANIFSFPMEGMLGIITSITLRLEEKPPAICALLFPFESEEIALKFADIAAKNDAVAALEYMDCRTIEIIESQKADMRAIADLPNVPRGTNGCIYIEAFASDEDELDDALMMLLGECIELGADADNVLAMSTESQIEQLRAFRHAASECVNTLVKQYNREDSTVCKLSLDIRWTADCDIDSVSLYRSKLTPSGLDYCIFGHIGNRAVYVNIISHDENEREKGEELFAQIISQAYNMGAQAFLEHGVGKIKARLFQTAAPKNIQEAVAKLKHEFDPCDMWNPGNREAVLPAGEA